MASGIRDYQIYLHRADGTLSIIMKLSAISHEDAAQHARTMLLDGIATAQIWLDGELVDSVGAIKPRLK
jgi:hypothetical protein